MTGVDLSSAELEGGVFLNVDFTGADLSDSNLIRAVCTLSTLNGACLTGAWLSRASFSGADLDGADLSVADVGDTDFSNSTLNGAILEGMSGFPVNFSQASMLKARMKGARMQHANFSEADLSGADLSASILLNANFSGANLENANLEGATLPHANFRGANCRGANFSNACIQYSNLVEADFSGAILDGAHVYGVSCWGTKLEGASQNSLLVTSHDEPKVPADQLDDARLTYLLINHEGVRGVIEQISSKGVLILGRFGPRKANLDAIRDALRTQGYLPLLCDFDAPADRDFTETVRILASLSRFIIADLTEPRCIPHELQAVVPDMAIPVRTIIEGDEVEYAMSGDLNKYPWVIREPFRYKDRDDLIARLPDEIIAVAEDRLSKIAELR